MWSSESINQWYKERYNLVAYMKYKKFIGFLHLLQLENKQIHSTMKIWWFSWLRSNTFWTWMICIQCHDSYSHGAEFISHIQLAISSTSDRVYHQIW